jgi:hypothetical protein
VRARSCFKGSYNLRQTFSLAGPSPPFDGALRLALKDHGSRFAKRVAKEYVFIALGGGNGVYSLAPPINRLRDDNRADSSPSQDPAPVCSFKLLDQDLF